MYFAMLGVVCSAWVSSIDDIQNLLQIGNDKLGLLLFFGPVGNLVSFAFASTLINRLGSRRSVQLFGSLYLGSALWLGLCYVLVAPFWLWCLGLMGFGGFGNILNISINTQAGEVEKRSGRNIMSTFHAAFSALMLLGGFVALGAAMCGIPVGLRMLVMIGIGIVAHLAMFRYLPVIDDANVKKEKAGWRRPDRLLFCLGLAAIVIMGCEGAVNEWITVFFRKTLASAEGDLTKFGKIGFCAFAVSIVIGRMFGGTFLNRFGKALVFRMHIALTALGLLIALSSPFLGLAPVAFILVATLGFVVCGFGISGLVPILYSNASLTKSMSPASALTFVGSMGFLGYFFGPPFIGFVSEHSNLSLALAPFALLVLLCLFLRFDRD